MSQLKRSTQRLVDWLQDQDGVTVKMARSGHYHVRLRGKLVTTMAGTPSNRRGLLNTVARLRRAGIPVPRRGEKKSGLD